ncbi:Uncharacterised protein [Mycobacteroides abscessus subsp. abscessus]|nr:Uncharacterised protein [Mycobacteroides abscessus subsp. abscessus]SKV51130.1 Uncharacterised protein [Mycobacteroides abscessus subsp. abscessus]
MGCQPSAISAVSATFLGPSAAISTGMRSRTGWLISFRALPRPVPCSGGSGTVKYLPSNSRRSRRHTLRQISTVSRVRPSGASYLTPWNPSITWGPEAPMPRTNRPPET